MPEQAVVQISGRGCRRGGGREFLVVEREADDAWAGAGGTEWALLEGVKRRRASFLVWVLGAMPAMAWADASMDRQIEQAIEASHNFRVVLQQRVEARSDEGVVTLSGTVQDLDQKALAESTARAQPGVSDVENELDVAFPGRERGDGWLELKIRGLLVLRSNVSARTTHVSVRDGIVTLSGRADTEAQRELVAAMARNIEGVKDVRNEIRVQPGGAVSVESARGGGGGPAAE